MSIIKIPVSFEGEKCDKVLYTLFDSGSIYSCLSPEVGHELANTTKFKRPLFFGTASEGTYIEVKEACRLDFYLNDIRLTDEFYIVPGLSEDAIIGATTMQKWRIKLDFESDMPIVDPKIGKIILINLINRDHSG